MYVERERIFSRLKNNVYKKEKKRKNSHNKNIASYFFSFFWGGDYFMYEYIIFQIAGNV